MPKGRTVRQDDITKEKLKVEGEKKLNRDMLNSLIGEEGPLQPGAMPNVKAASEAGKQLLLQNLDDDKKQVTKAKAKTRAKAKEEEPVGPKTAVQWGPQ